MEREADVSGILSQTVDVIGGAGRAVLVYVLVLGLFSGLGGLLGLASLDDDWFSARIVDGALDTQTMGLFGGLFELASLILFVIATYLLLSRMMAAVGRPLRGGQRFWSFLGMSILAAIGVMIGFVLLIIPGIIIMVRWSAANGFVLSGGHSVTGSLGASWEATDGHGLSIFGAGLLLWLGLAVVSGVVAGIAVGAGMNGADGLFSPTFAIAMTAAGVIEAFGNAASFAFSVAVFHLVAPADTSVADVFE